MKKALVKVNLEYSFPDEMSDCDIMWEIENIELPIEYASDSWEFINIEETLE